jgi:hypothetical protein
MNIAVFRMTRPNAEGAHASRGCESLRPYYVRASAQKSHEFEIRYKGWFDSSLIPLPSFLGIVQSKRLDESRLSRLAVSNL